MKKSLWRHVGRAALYMVIGGALAPLYHILEFFLLDDPAALTATLALYKDPFYWLIIVLAVAVVYPTVIYFKEINPRTFVHLYDVVWATAALCLLIGGEVMALLFVLFNLSEHRGLMILAFVACGAVLLLGLYAIVCRGVAIYQKGKVRVFKFRIYTYHTDTVDDLSLEYSEGKYAVHLVVQGDMYTFPVSKGSAELIQKRLKALKINGELEEYDP